MVNDWERLGITPVNNKEYIFKALRESVKEANFESDLEQVFKYLETYKSLVTKVDRTTSELDKLTSQKKDSSDENEVIMFLDAESIYSTPEQLVERFKEIYQNPALRFNKLIWKSAIANAKTHSEVELNVFCLPIIKFLNYHFAVKSDVLGEIRKAFPFLNYFNSNEWKEVLEVQAEFKKIETFLKVGHSDIELYVECLKEEPLTLAEKDLLIKHLITADDILKKGKIKEAYILLANEIPDDKKPAFVWRKMLNIVFRAGVEYRQEGALSIFINTLNASLSYYPEDRELLYIRALYFFKAESNLLKVQEQLINTLKIIPNYEKVYYLLARIYLELKKYDEALIIFRNLQKTDPLNGAYIVYTASTFRHYIAKRLNDSNVVRDKGFYLDMLNQLISLDLFEEINELKAEIPLYPDLEALLLFSEALEKYSSSGEKDFEKLDHALSLTANREIVFKIKKHYLDNMLTWDEIASKREAIMTFHEEFPESWLSIYHKGKYFYAVGEFQHAYDCYKQAFELNADATYIYYSMAQACQRLQRYEEAVEYISLDMQKSRYSISSAKILAICCFRMGNYSRAFTEYKWLFSIIPPKDIIKDHLYYYACSLYNYINQLEASQTNVKYKTTLLKDGLDLFEELPKPKDFYTSYLGSETLHWLTSLCRSLHLNTEGLHYTRQILVHCSYVKEWIHEEATDFELYFMRELGMNQEIIEKLLDKTTKSMEEDTNNSSLALRSFYIAFAYDGLGDLENELKWKTKTAYYYANMEGEEYRTETQLEWLENFTVNIVNRFEGIFEHKKTIEAGKVYFDIQKTPHFRYTMVAYYMAIAYEAIGNKEKSLQYHQKVIEYDKQFPDVFADFAEISRLILNKE
ncbi:hypothetical protein ABWH96_16050 [Marivirga tractuosa]|uniref:tetratricopeptide repeat protein n=1 Tax=Marivirga tractuosa TaxID=1006 RepID=UPI0035CF26B8